MLVGISLCTLLFSVFLFVNYYSSNTSLFDNIISSCDFAQQCEKFCPISTQQSDWTKTLDASKATPQQVIDYFYWANASSCRLSHDFGGKMMKNPSGLDGDHHISQTNVNICTHIYNNVLSVSYMSFSLLIYITIILNRLSDLDWSKRCLNLVYLRNKKKKEKCLKSPP